MVRMKEGYAPSWDEFITKLMKMRSDQWRAFMGEARISGRLSLIVQGADDFLARKAATRAQSELRAQQQRLIEAHRTTRNDAALRNYGSAATRAQLPATALHPQTVEQRRVNMKATACWRLSWSTSARNSSARIARLMREAGDRTQQWRAAHAFGDPVTQTELDEFAASLRALRPSERRRMKRGYAPVGMTADRALQIAIDVLQRRS